MRLPIAGMRDVDQKDAHDEASLADAVFRSRRGYPRQAFISRKRSESQAALGITTGAHFRRHADGAKSPLASAEIDHGGGEIVAVEVGPHAIGEMELGIGALPEQEIGQPFLAAGADQEIDVAAGVPAGKQPAECLAREASSPPIADAARRIASREE